MYEVHLRVGQFGFNVSATMVALRNFSVQQLLSDIYLQRWLLVAVFWLVGH